MLYGLTGEGGVELFALQVRVSFQTCYPLLDKSSLSRDSGHEDIPSIPDICPVNEVGQPELSVCRVSVVIDQYQS